MFYNVLRKHAPAAHHRVLGFHFAWPQKDFWSLVLGFLPTSFYLFFFSLLLVLVRPILLIDLTSPRLPPNASHATVFLHLGLTFSSHDRLHTRANLLYLSLVWFLVVNDASHHTIQLNATVTTST
jgi:hypothetical protein